MWWNYEPDPVTVHSVNRADEQDKNLAAFGDLAPACQTIQNAQYDLGDIRAATRRLELAREDVVLKRNLSIAGTFASVAFVAACATSVHSFVQPPNEDRKMILYHEAQQACRVLARASGGDDLSRASLQPCADDQYEQKFRAERRDDADFAIVTTLPAAFFLFAASQAARSVRTQTRRLDGLTHEFSALEENARVSHATIDANMAVLAARGGPEAQPS